MHIPLYLFPYKVWAWPHFNVFPQALLQTHDIVAHEVYSDEAERAKNMLKIFYSLTVSPAEHKAECLKKLKSWIFENAEKTWKLKSLRLRWLKKVNILIAEQFL